MGLFSKKNIAELTVGVEGMHCPMCVKNLTRGLKETDGITAVVEVSLEKKQATVKYDADKINAEGIKAVVAECGYQPV